MIQYQGKKLPSNKKDILESFNIDCVRTITLYFNEVMFPNILKGNRILMHGFQDLILVVT